MLTNGRCLPTCSKNQFFDKTSSSCQSCDSSCSSCSGAGPSNCLACSSSSQVLRGGTCASVSCNNSSTVVSGLGICLSDLVEVPSPSVTKSSPLPTISGIDAPVPLSSPKTSSRPLAWWEILLMALGCAFIFVVILMLWRRHARKKRAKATAMFATAKRLDRQGGWRWRLMRFGEKLFGHNRSRLVPARQPEPVRMEKLRDPEEARYSRDMDKFLDAYDYSRAGSSRVPSPLPSLRDYDREVAYPVDNRPPPNNRFSGVSLTSDSIYSHVTGLPRSGPQPRQPVRNARELLPSRFSDATSSHASPYPSPPLAPRVGNLIDTSRPPTPAQEYARLVMQHSGPQESRGAYWIQPTDTGNSRNPFLNRA